MKQQEKFSCVTYASETAGPGRLLLHTPLHWMLPRHPHVAPRFPGTLGMPPHPDHAALAPAELHVRLPAPHALAPQEPPDPMGAVPSHLQIPSALSATPLQSLSALLVQFREPGGAGRELQVALPPPAGHTTVPER